MPSKRKNLVNIHFMTDDETGMYYVGEIDGLFSDDELEKFLNDFKEKGKDELLNHLSYLQHCVWKKWFEIMKKDDEHLVAKNV